MTIVSEFSLFVPTLALNITAWPSRHRTDSMQNGHGTTHHMVRHPVAAGGKKSKGSCRTPTLTTFQYSARPLLPRGGGSEQECRAAGVLSWIYCQSHTAQSVKAMPQILGAWQNMVPSNHTFTRILCTTRPVNAIFQPGGRSSFLEREAGCPRKGLGSPQYFIRDTVEET